MQRVYKKEFQTDSKVIAYGAEPRYSQNPSLIEKWGLQPNSYYLIVGRLIPDNNSDLILEGFLQSLSDKKLVIVGDVPFQDAFAKKIKARSLTTDRVIMTGYVNEAETLAELYHHCYAYLHGHEFGGTNPTMLKAMAYGCAILALKTPFNDEMLADGSFGDFFNKSIDSVSEKIKDFDLHPKRVTDLKNHSRSGISKKYTWDHVCDQYMDAIYGLMGIR